MHLIYIDELKLHAPHQPYQWLCGLAVPSDVMLEAEAKLSDLAQGFFKSPLLCRETEFHAKEIVHGSGPFKGRQIQERIALYQSLLSLIEEYHGKIKKIEVRINPKLIQFPRDIADQAFMFFVEQCDRLMKSLQSVGLLIADSDPTKITPNVKNLSFFRQYSTEYALNRKIRYLVDTIHHTHSHHSRFLQLADIYTYSCALCALDQTKYFQRSLKEHIQKNTKILRSDRYKYWPTTNSVWLPTATSAVVTESVMRDGI